MAQGRASHLWGLGTEASLTLKNLAGHGMAFTEKTQPFPLRLKNQGISIPRVTTVLGE